MPYNKHTGTDNEVITAAKLNNMENGIADSISTEPAPSALIINETETYDSEGGDHRYTLNKTWQEIYDAYHIGPVFIRQLDNTYEEEDSFLVPDDPNNPDGSTHLEVANVTGNSYVFIVVYEVGLNGEEGVSNPDYFYLKSHPISNISMEGCIYTADSANGYPYFISTEPM